MATSNNVTRLLVSKKIHFKAYELPAEKLGASETARLLGMDPLYVFKTIVLKREKGKPILAVIPGTHHVDLKMVAAALDEKKISLTTEREAEQMTGLQAGGISPLALINKGFQVLIDSCAENLQEIHISGGQRGLNISLRVNDLAGLVHALIVPISAAD